MHRKQNNKVSQSQALQKGGKKIKLKKENDLDKYKVVASRSVV